MRKGLFQKRTLAVTDKAFRAFLTGAVVLSLNPAMAIAAETPSTSETSSAMQIAQNVQEESTETSATNIGSADSPRGKSNALSESDYTQLSLSPAILTALESGKTYNPGTYTGTATVVNKGTDEWGTYSISVKVTIDAAGKISAVALTDESYANAAADNSDNETYLENAELGTRKAAGVAAQVVQNQDTGNIVAVSGATYSSSALVEAVNDALSKAAEQPDDYVYLYAALTYGEYYASEDVQAAGSVAPGTQVDTHNEMDTGAFDAVSRATTNHGLHRGSYQSTSVIYGESGKTYQVNSWNSGSEAVLADGSVITFSRGNITSGSETDVMDHYEVLGFKYVPVAVKRADLDAFKAAYAVVENGEELAGGYSEGVLSSYKAVAAVDKNTNGLKVATKNTEDGSFTFGERQKGTESGIEGSSLKVADPATLGVTTKDTKTGKALAGSYGDFLRVDLKSNYGDLGANMQAVFWEYYGSGDTVLATYGTKFAADNWMHKSNGIQLGLTDSARCTLPAGTDGTGVWKVTICAMGYQDTVLTLNVDESDINNAHSVSSTTVLEQAISAAEALNESDYTAASWAALSLELAEAKEQLELAAQGPTKTTQEAVDEATAHLNEALENLKLYVLSVDLATDTSLAKVGDTLNVHISLKGDKIASAQGTLSYDNKILRLVGFNTENSQLSAVENFASNESGEFSFFGNATDFTNGGVVAEAQFEVIGAGSADICLDANTENVAGIGGGTRDIALVPGEAAHVALLPANVKKGDVNNNGKINIVDAQIAYDLATNVYGDDYAPLLQLGEGWTKETVRYVADVSGTDGVIDAVDAFAIQHYALFQSWE